MFEVEKKIFSPVRQYFQTLAEILLEFVEYYEKRLVKLTFLLLHFTSPSRIAENRQKVSYYVFCFTLFAFIGIIALDNDEPFKKEENLKPALMAPLFDLNALQKIIVFHIYDNNISIPLAAVSAFSNKAPPSFSS